MQNNISIWSKTFLVSYFASFFQHILKHDLQSSREEGEKNLISPFDLPLDLKKSNTKKEEGEKP